MICEYRSLDFLLTMRYIGGQYPHSTYLIILLRSKAKTSLFLLCLAHNLVCFLKLRVNNPDMFVPLNFQIALVCLKSTHLLLGFFICYTLFKYIKESNYPWDSMARSFFVCFCLFVSVLFLLDIIFWPLDSFILLT